MLRPRSQAGGGDMDDLAEEGLLESEQARLLRSYRVMQNDYKAYKEETKRILNKQNMLISALEREQLELDTIMCKMEANQNISKDEFHGECLSKLSQQEKDYQKIIEEEQEKNSVLDRQIIVMEREICEQRKKMGGVHISTMKHNAIQKKIGVLENRLDKAVVHFNQQLAENKMLREEIDHYRRERGVFENLHKKLSRELTQCKHDIAHVIHTSTQAFEQRDEAQGKMQALKERMDKDRQTHNVEMKELQRIISHDNRVKEFMKVKSNDRNEFKAEEAAKRQRAGDEKVDHDKATIAAYEEAFSQIQQVTGQHDLEDIVQSFIRSEEENFALFNYVNELNSEVETVQEEVGSIKADMNSFQNEESMTQTSRKDTLKKIETEYRILQKESTMADDRLREINKVLDELRSSINTVFHQIGCDAKPIRDMLGGDAGLNNKNVMIYLGLVEHRTMNLLYLRNYLKMKKSDLEGNKPGKQEQLLTSPPSVSDVLIVPPPIWDDDEEESELGDDEFGPLSESDMREHVRKCMERRPTHVTFGGRRPSAGVTSGRDSKNKNRNKSS